MWNIALNPPEFYTLYISTARFCLLSTEIIKNQQKWEFLHTNTYGWLLVQICGDVIMTSQGLAVYYSMSI